MRSGFVWRRWFASLFAGAGLTVLSAAPTPAQTYCPPAPCPTPIYQIPWSGVPTQPAPGVTPPSTAIPTPPTTPTPEAPSPVSVEPESSALALSGGTVALAAPGYVDFAVPVTQFRLRFDAAYDNNRPDRAEFFYAKCGCFAQFGQRAPGPPLLETRVDYQELRPYLEVAWSKRFSTFIEAPVRFINPEQNANEAGFGNLVAGFKYALIACPDQYLTFQLTTTTPTADTDRGLGNELVTLEPGILWLRQLTDRLTLNAELRDWIPINGTDFAGNILRYGTAVTYLAYNTRNFRIYPIGEVVGWTVLGGKELAVFNPGSPNGVNAVTQTLDASGDTIVNAKVGVRFGFGQLIGPALLSRSDLYIGYGRALTGDVWYKDILRVEYSLRF
jgi:hypothetical protein